MNSRKMFYYYDIKMLFRKVDITLNMTTGLENEDALRF